MDVSSPVMPRAAWFNQKMLNVFCSKEIFGLIGGVPDKFFLVVMRIFFIFVVFCVPKNC